MDARLHIVCLTATLALLAPAARAETPSNVTPYEVDPTVEIPVTVVAFALAGAPRLWVGKLIDGPDCGLECDPRSVNPLDRTVIGLRSQTAAHVSDAAFISSMLLPHALGALDALLADAHDGLDGYATDTLILLETLTWTLAINNAFNMAVQRPRPIAYDASIDADIRTDANQALSFFSGHTSASFAMATAYSRLFMQRHPDSPAVLPVWLGSHALATTTALGRVGAGQHFWSDVLVGALVGITMGNVVPRLHERNRPDEIGPRFGLIPTFGPSGLGLALEIQ
jgi:membrane-associated phospholipid phosphatase